MRALNFRDNVLWPITYKLGLNPAENLLVDHADALASFINAWVRREWDAADFAEWTETRGFVVVGDHLILWSVSSDYQGRVLLSPIGRPLKTYVIDPATTWSPVDIPFRLNDKGIHCGFYHGSVVWLKYIPTAPQFTTKAWDAGVSYAKGQLTYSPVTGECYKSKIGANRGHDPALGGSSEPIPLPTEVMQEATLDEPGLPAASKIMVVKMEILGGGSIPDPPALGSVFTINVYNNSGAVIATATQNGTGAASLASILGALRTTLIADPDLAAFTIVNDTTALTMTLTAPQEFSVDATYAPTIVSFQLVVTQQQAYTPATAPTAGVSQVTKVTITNSMVKRDATFVVTFIDALGDSHLVSYTATVNDAALQVLDGLADALAAAAANDPVLAAVQSTIDIASSAINFTSSKATAIDAEVDAPAPQYWDLMPFPEKLVDAVVRGAYADALKEQGQTDKGAAEEQLVPTEAGLTLKKQTSEQYDPLTDQQRGKTRYSVQ